MKTIIPTANIRHKTTIENYEIGTAGTDVGALEAELQNNIKGEVRFDDGSRALYAADASNYRQVPIGVVIPKDKEDVIKTVQICHKYGAPILGRGGGTSLAGQCCNVAVVLDFSKYMNRVLEIDPEKKTARVQPGTILDDLRDQAEKYHLTFGPDPATHNRNTLGGMIGNDSCGVHSIMAGKTVDNVIELEILTYDGLHITVGKVSDEELEKVCQQDDRQGEIYRKLKKLRDNYAGLIREKFPDIPRRVSGYNLNQLLPENGFNVAGAIVGSECTCAIVLEATVRLVHSPPYRSLLVLGYADVYTAADSVPELMSFKPIGLEGMDDELVEFMREKGLHPEDIAELPEGNGWLLAEFGGESQEEAHGNAQKAMDQLNQKDNHPHMKLFDAPAEQKKLWRVRESSLGATAFVPHGHDAWPGWEDSAVPPDKLGDYLRELRKLISDYGYRASFYGHFGQGCLHCRITFDLKTAAGIRNFIAFISDAADLVIKYGGSLSGEHGDGQARAALTPKMFGDELIGAFREFKTIWDPQGKMNPGKMVDAYRPDENLRLGTDYNPPELNTYFKFMQEDEGSFAHAAMRCVGVGLCRRHDGGTMCPSYMVTHEEKHSTRGRAHLLFEMLKGNPLKNGWRDEQVREALDLCLACKGCKGDCPVNVDMATYKAEFLAHYYKGRLRPVAAYSMGLIYWWAGLASRMPVLVNLLTHAPITGDIAKKLGGIAPQRKIPTFARQTFKEWFRRRGSRNQDKPKVILWPDTFNNHFHVTTAQAATEVLEAAGYQVIVPEKSLCCGRPLYDWGMLNLAKKLLEQILQTLKDEIEAGTPVVVLEPSCASVFLDEMTNLLPNNQDARRLKNQTYTLDAFLKKVAKDYHPPKLKRKALVHGHCHHKSVMHMHPEEALLQESGLDYRMLDSGCCGMAGAFGFEKGEHYDVSIKAGERVLLPAVRNADKETLIITDGFSCREQIAQTTDRQALHLAQVLQMAMQEGNQDSSGEYPEKKYCQDGHSESPLKLAQKALASIKTLAAVSGITALILHRRKA
ncbi:MAG TPA: FAD-binding and (Fe-S)-binding domain-containing protein [Chloroflexia bacterium]|nr:FAD-binding and (Fe-S)-binding domain-containing protein [Chloroflexia bacterium]